MLENCLNCESPITENHDFCSNCGAKQVRQRLTLKMIMTDVVQAITNFEGPVWRTLKDLTIRPYAVTSGYVDGLRKRYVSPAKYLFASVMLTGLYFYFFQDDLADFQNGFQEGMELGGGDPNTEESQKAAKDMEAFQQQMFDKMQFIIYLVVPLYALLSKWFFNKQVQYNYAEHLAVNAYAVSHASVIGVVVGGLVVFILGKDLGMIVQLAFSVLYSGWVIGKVFKKNFWKGLLFYILSYIGAFIIMMIVFAIGGIIYLLVIKGGVK